MLPAMKDMVFAVVVAVLVAVLAASCTPPPDVTVPGSDGGKDYLIRCRDRQNCLLRAARYCPGGYVDRNEARSTHEMLVRCKEAPGATPTASDSK